MSPSSPAAVPSSHVDLLTRPLPAVLVTVMPDGRPQASVVWTDFRDGVVSVNTEEGRRKTKNLRADGRATLLVVDPADQHRYLELRCDVARITTEGALEHRAALDRAHLGDEHVTDPTADRGRRLIVELVPVAVHAYG